MDEAFFFSEHPYNKFLSKPIIFQINFFLLIKMYKCNLETLVKGINMHFIREDKQANTF